MIEIYEAINDCIIASNVRPITLTNIYDSGKGGENDLMFQRRR